MMMPQNIFAQRSLPIQQSQPNYPIQQMGGVSPIRPVGQPINRWGGQPPTSGPMPVQAQPPQPIAPMPQPITSPIVTNPQLAMGGQPQPGAMQPPPNLQNILALRSMRMMSQLSY